MLWFDVSDIINKKTARLTGTERSSTNILRLLTSIRSDVRLLRFDAKKAALCEASAAADLNAHKVLDAAEMKSSPALLDALSNMLASAKSQILGGEIQAASKTKKTGPASITTNSRPISFKPGDVILSLASNRSRPGYGDAIAAARAEVPVKCLNLLYDIIPLLFPQWVSEESAQRFSQWARQQILNADMLLTISEFQKREIATFLSLNGFPEKPIEVIYLGDTHFNQAVGKGEGDARTHPLDAPTTPYVLCVSSLDVRKNHYCLYHVWRRLSAELGDDCPKLVLVGKQISLSQDLIYQMTHDPAVRELIVLRTDGVADDELGWYYDNCLFTVFPSFYEGWGLPVAENSQSRKVLHREQCSLDP